MIHFRILTAFWVLAFISVSCTEEVPEVPLGELEKGVLIINEGAFGANDGEVYHYDPVSGDIKTDIFESKNGRPFAGLIQDMIEAEGKMYLVANTGKVEIVDPKDFSSLGAVDADLNISRSLAVANQKLYISDWGPYDENFNSPDSYVAVVNGLNGGTVSKKIPVPSRPEGLIVSGNFLYVACAADKKLQVISLATDAVTNSQDVEGTPSKLQIIDGRLYLFARDAGNIYFHEINRNNFNIQNTIKIPLENSTSNFSVAEGGEVYVLTSTGWPDYNDAVAKVSLNSAAVVNPSLFIGSGLYGIGFHPESKEIYIADNNGFQGSGTVIVINGSGQQVKTLEVGRGPSGFRFK
jgi:DNA-binding beta-propeller fold protein YncE